MIDPVTLAVREEGRATLDWEPIPPHSPAMIVDRGLAQTRDSA